MEPTSTYSSSVYAAGRNAKTQSLRQKSEKRRRSGEKRRRRKKEKAEEISLYAFDQL